MCTTIGVICIYFLYYRKIELHCRSQTDSVSTNQHGVAAAPCEPLPSTSSVQTSTHQNLRFPRSSEKRTGTSTSVSQRSSKLSAVKTPATTSKDTSFEAVFQVIRKEKNIMFLVTDQF